MTTISGSLSETLADAQVEPEVLAGPATLDAQGRSSHLGLETIEDAIYDWIYDASGLPRPASEDEAPRVIWTHERGPQPDRPFIMLGLVALDTIGQGWVDRRRNAAPSPAPGTEAVLKARMPQRYTLQLECFAWEMSGLDGAVGVLGQVRATVPFYRGALSSRRIGVGTIGPISTVGSAKLDKLLEPRATCEFGLHVRSEAIGFAHEIRQVEVTGAGRTRVVSRPATGAAEVSLADAGAAGTGTVA